MGPGLSDDRVLGLLSHTSTSKTPGPSAEGQATDYAESFLQRNNPTVREKAMTLMEESLEIANELGMRPLVER